MDPTASRVDSLSQHHTNAYGWLQEGNNIPDGMAMAMALAKSPLIPGATIACVPHISVHS